MIPHRVGAIAGVVATVAASFAGAWLVTDAVESETEGAELPARTRRAVDLAPSSGPVAPGVEPADATGTGGSGSEPETGLEPSAGPEYPLDSPTLTPTGDDRTGAVFPIGEELGLPGDGGVLRFFDPCADGGGEADCPGGVQGTILALTSPGPFEILGATLDPLPGVDPAYDLCRSYYGADTGSGEATLAIYSTHPGDFTIQGSASRSTESTSGGGTGTATETSSPIPRTEATTTIPQTNTWIRELEADRPNPGVITCRRIPGINPGDGVRLRIAGRTLASVVGRYTPGGEDRYELSTTYAGPRRRPPVVVRPVGALELEVTMVLRRGEFSAVAAKETSGAQAGNECSRIRPPFTGAVVELAGSTVHVARFRGSVRLPDVLVRSPAWPYDPSYRDVWTWRLEFPQGIDREFLAVCGWAFDDQLQIRDAQAVPVQASRSMRVEVDLTLHGLDTSSFAVRDLWLELRGGRRSCTWENPTGATSATRICTLRPSREGRLFEVRANLPSRGTGPPDRIATTRFALRTECLVAGRVRCDDFDERVRIGLPAFGAGYGELTLKYRTGFGGCFCLIGGSISHRPPYWFIGAGSSVSLSAYPPLDVPARAQPRLVLEQTRLVVGVRRGTVELQWASDRPVLISAAIEGFERDDPARDAGCLSDAESSGGAQLRTSGSLELRLRRDFDCDGLYSVSITITSENGVSASYDSIAPLRPGTVGSSISARCPGRAAQTCPRT